MPQLIGNLLGNRGSGLAFCHLPSLSITKTIKPDLFSEQRGLILSHSTAPESLSRTFGDMKDRGEIEVPRNKLRGISDCLVS